MEELHKELQELNHIMKGLIRKLDINHALMINMLEGLQNVREETER